MIPSLPVEIVRVDTVCKVLEMFRNVLFKLGNVVPSILSDPIKLGLCWLS